MGTSAREAPSGQPGTPIPSQADLESRKTQQTNQQQAPSTEQRPGENVDTTQQPVKEPSAEQRLIAAQEAALRDQHRQITELTQRVRGIDERTRPVEPTPPSEADLNQDFWKNPAGVVSQLIKQEIKQTVAPLNEQLSRMSQTTQMSEVDRTKARVKEEYKDIWDKIEPAIDEFLESHKRSGNDVTPQLLEVAALTATGAYHRGKLQLHGVPVTPEPTPTARTENPPRENRSMGDAPAHLRPSAPNAPTHDQKQAAEVRQLTENEARLARERGMTPEQYINWLQTPPEQVIHSKIGKEAPKS